MVIHRVNPGLRLGRQRNPLPRTQESRSARGGRMSKMPVAFAFWANLFHEHLLNDEKPFWEGKGLPDRGEVVAGEAVEGEGFEGNSNTCAWVNPPDILRISAEAARNLAQIAFGKFTTVAA